MMSHVGLDNNTPLHLGRSPESPFLYNMTVTMGADSVGSYFGMREISLCKDPKGTARPCVNGKFRFLAGFLDQSWWPDGQYLAPGDEALAFDVAVLKVSSTAAATGSWVRGQACAPRCR